MASSSRQFVHQLQDQGLTQRQIGQRLGRSPSMISKIATGAKPGANLADALEALVRGERPAVPPADPRNPRATQRRPDGTTRGFRVHQTPAGPEADASPTSMRALVRHLAARGDERAAFVVRWINADGERKETKLFGTAGVRPATVLRRWHKHTIGLTSITDARELAARLSQRSNADLLDALLEWLAEEGNYSLDGLVELLGVTLTPFGGDS